MYYTYIILLYLHVYLLQVLTFTVNLTVFVGLVYLQRDFLVALASCCAQDYCTEITIYTT